MKVKENYLLRQVMGNWVVVPVGSAGVSFRGMLTLNGSGVFLWRALQKECTLEELVTALTDAYEVKEEEARQDIAEFLDTIRKTGCLEG